MNHQAALSALTQASGWRKSRYSIAQNDCVEITTEVPGWVGVRDSKLGASSPLLPFNSVQWTAFLDRMVTALPETAKTDPGWC